MPDIVYEKLPAFGVELLSAALRVDDRQWVPLMHSKHRRCKFASWEAAETYVYDLQRSQPHLKLRIVPFDGAF